MDGVELFGQQTTHLNQIQIDEARTFLTSLAFVNGHKENYCGCGSDDNKGCGKTASQLLILWQSEQIRRGRSTNRKHPVLVVNEKKGYGLHRIITINGNLKVQYYGNVNYFCKSCNMLNDRRTGDIQPDEIATFQARKSHDIRPRFKNKLSKYLMNHTHVCYNECINKWSGSPEFKCSQDPLISAFKQELDVVFDLIEISEFNIKCDYKDCNGKHIIIKGEPPLKDLSQQDVDAFLKENKK